MAAIFLAWGGVLSTLGVILLSISQLINLARIKKLETRIMTMTADIEQNRLKYGNLKEALDGLKRQK